MPAAPTSPDSDADTVQLWIHLHDELVDHGRLQLQSLVIGLSAVTITASVLAAGRAPVWWGPLIGYLPIAVSALVYTNRARAMAVISTYLRVRVEPNLPAAHRWETELSRLRASEPYRRMRLTGTPHFLVLGIVAAALSAATVVLGAAAHRVPAIISSSATFSAFAAAGGLARRSLRRAPAVFEAAWAPSRPTPEPGATSPAPSPQVTPDRPRLKKLRTKWEHEDALVDRRTTWLLTGQSLLVAGYALSVKQGDQVAPNAIAAVGIAIAALVGVSIWAAGLALLQLWRRSAEITQAASAAVPIEDRVDVNGALSVLGYAAAALMPFVFIGLWIWLLAR